MHLPGPLGLFSVLAYILLYHGFFGQIFGRITEFEPEGLGHEPIIITLQGMQGLRLVESCMEPCSFPELM